MKHDIVKFVAKCLECQQVKTDHCHPASLLQPHNIPMTKWEVIYMDFITRLLLTPQGHNSILVVVDKLMKNTHFIPVRDIYEVVDVAQVFINEIIRFHGVPKKTISDRDSMIHFKVLDLYAVIFRNLTKFKYNLSSWDWWKTERVNQVLKDMLRMYIINQQTH